MNRNGKVVRTHVARVKAASPAPSSTSGRLDLAGWLNQIHQGDALETMRRLPTGSIGLIVTSPPYNRLNSSGNGMKGRSGGWNSNPLSEGYGEHDDAMNVADYIEWQRKCVWEMCRLLAPEGAIFYVHRGRVQHGEWEDHGRTILRELPRGFQLRQVAIWEQGGGPNKNPGYLIPDHEYIFIIARRGEWKDPATMGMRSVWNVRTDREPRGVPAFPAEIPRRAIQCSPYAAVVLDPFIGSGSTGVAAVMEGRTYIGIDNDPKMVQAARRRIREAGETVHQETVQSPETVHPDVPSGETVHQETVQPPETVQQTVHPHVASGETVHQETVQVRAEPIDKVIYDLIHDRTEEGRLGAVQIDIADFEHATGRKRRAIMYGLGRLSEQSLITKKQSRGASYYSISGAIPRWPAKVAGGLGSAPETVHQETVQQTVHAQFLPGIPEPGTGLITQSPDENLKPGTGFRVPGAREDAQTEASNPGQPLCPIHQNPNERRRTRYRNLVAVMQANGDEIVYCWGANGDCSWVHSRDRGTVVDAGTSRLDALGIETAYNALPPPAKPERNKWAEASHPTEMLSPDCADITDPAGVWQAVLGRLQAQMPRNIFNTFLRPCVGHSWRDGDLVAAAVSSFAVSWLELPMHQAMANEALGETVGRPAAVRYRTMPNVTSKPNF